MGFLDFYLEDWTWEILPCTDQAGIQSTRSKPTMKNMTTHYYLRNYQSLATDVLLIMSASWSGEKPQLVVWRSMTKYPLIKEGRLKRIKVVVADSRADQVTKSVKCSRRGKRGGRRKGASLSRSRRRVARLQSRRDPPKPVNPYAFVYPPSPPKDPVPGPSVEPLEVLDVLRSTPEAPYLQTWTRRDLTGTRTPSVRPVRRSGFPSDSCKICGTRLRGGRFCVSCSITW